MGMEKEGKSWEWSDPTGHDRCEVCVPLWVNRSELEEVKATRANFDTEEAYLDDKACDRQVCMYVLRYIHYDASEIQTGWSPRSHVYLERTRYFPEHRKGRFTTMATPTIRAAIAVAQGDTPAVVKLLRDGMLPPDYKFKPEEVGRSEHGLSPPFCTKTDDLQDRLGTNIGHLIIVSRFPRSYYSGVNLLHLAAASVDSPELIEALEACGVPYVGKDAGAMPLEWAARAGFLNVMKMLIARGQKPPAGPVGKGGSYTMALGFAAKAGQLVATELLLSCYLREGAVRM
jgi:ankyrin repeat protein